MIYLKIKVCHTWKTLSWICGWRGGKVSLFVAAVLLVIWWRRSLSSSSASMTAQWISRTLLVCDIFLAVLLTLRTPVAESVSQTELPLVRGWRGKWIQGRRRWTIPLDVLFLPVIQLCLQSRVADLRCCHSAVCSVMVLPADHVSRRLPTMCEWSDVPAWLCDRREKTWHLRFDLQIQCLPLLKLLHAALCMLHLSPKRNIWSCGHSHLYQHVQYSGCMLLQHLHCL